MNGNIALRPARPEEAAALAEISRRAFEGDTAVGAPGPGGPPGYDSPQWQAQMMTVGSYHAIASDGVLIGGAIVFRMGPGHYELGRIFLDPDRHGQGIGKQVMALLFAAYPLARRWTLDTPVWNMRTRHFYESLGFVVIGERRERGGPNLVLYERRVGSSGPPDAYGGPGGGRHPSPPVA